MMETLSGVMQRLNNDMQAGKFQPFINTMVNGMSMIGNGIAWVVENLNWIAPVLAGVITALVMFGQYGLGLAPIGHTVTVKTSTDLAVNVTGSIKLRPGESFDVVKELVEDAVSEYIGGIGFTEETVYYAKLVANMLGASTAIRDVQNVTINGQSANIDLVKTFTNYQVPILGTITLSEVEAP